MSRFEGKIAIVTGAGSGIGAATAKRFLGEQRLSFEWHDVEAEPGTLEIVHDDPLSRDVAVTWDAAP